MRRCHNSMHDGNLFISNDALETSRFKISSLISDLSIDPNKNSWPKFSFLVARILNWLLHCSTISKTSSWMWAVLTDEPTYLEIFNFERALVKKFCKKSVRNFVGLIYYKVIINQSHVIRFKDFFREKSFYTFPKDLSPIIVWWSKLM